MPYRAVSACGGQQRFVWHPVGDPPREALILATPQGDPGEAEKRTRDFLDMALCERLSVLCGVVARTRAFRRSYGHTALPCGLLQLSLVSSLPGRRPDVFPAHFLSRGGSLVEPQGSPPPGAPRQTPPGV